MGGGGKGQWKAHRYVNNSALLASYVSAALLHVFFAGEAVLRLLKIISFL